MPDRSGKGVMEKRRETRREEGGRYVSTKVMEFVML